MTWVRLLCPGEEPNEITEESAIEGWIRDASGITYEFVIHWSETTDIPMKRFVGWIGIARGKFFDWKSRYGKINEHNDHAQQRPGRCAPVGRRSPVQDAAVRICHRD